MLIHRTTTLQILIHISISIIHTVSFLKITIIMISITCNGLRLDFHILTRYHVTNLEPLCKYVEVKRMKEMDIWIYIFITILQYTIIQKNIQILRYYIIISYYIDVRRITNLPTAAIFIRSRIVSSTALKLFSFGFLLTNRFKHS